MMAGAAAALSVWVPAHEQPKAATFLLTLPFLPRTVAGIAPFLVLGTLTCLALHALSPTRTDVPLSTTERAVVATNMLLSLASALAVPWLARGGIYEVEALPEVPAVELLLVALWAGCDEVFFFAGHWLLHRKLVYKHIHKMHHKFKVTSAWTSFYAHPLDNLFVMWAALGAPAAMMRHGWVRCSVPVVVLFMFAAVVTFICSHHTVRQGKGKGGKAGVVAGTGHLQHHLHFNVNYGNFTMFDAWFDTLAKDKRP